MTDRPVAAWRDAAAYDRLAGIDGAGLMWEWLRRDPDYVAWYTKASAATRGTAGGVGLTVNDPLQWGVHFRRGPARCRPQREDHLACRFRSRHAPGPCPAGRLE